MFYFFPLCNEIRPELFFASTWVVEHSSILKKKTLEEEGIYYFELWSAGIRARKVSLMERAGVKSHGRNRK